MDDSLLSQIADQIKYTSGDLTEEQIAALKFPHPKETTTELFGILDFVGANPTNFRGIKKLLWCFHFGCQIFWLIIIAGYNFCCYLDMTEFMEHIMFIAIVMQVIIKFLIAVIYRENLEEILNILFNVFWNVDNLIVPARVMYISYNILLRKFVVSYRWLFIISIFITAAETMYATSMGPITKVWTPNSVDFNNDQPYAFLFFLFELFSISGCVLLAIVPFDSLFMMMTASAYIQFECLKCTIKNIDCTNKNMANAELSKCVNYHNLLLEYLGKIEVVYAISLMSQLSASISTICIAIYLWTTSENIILRPFLYALCSSAQLFAYCFGGQMITDQSASLADAAFESNWWKLHDKSFREGIIMIIQRSNREVHISAGGVYILSMDLFMKILRASVSFMTLLKNSIAK